ncbi:MAG: uroporphyrinogen-III synthase, partial [Bryobacteraceae bacterium]
MSFAGKRVLSLESRRASEAAELIRRQGGDPFAAPSMREVPMEENPEAFRFAEGLFAGEFDMVIFLTGVGTRYLHKILSTRYPPERFGEALRGIVTVARGPKPAAVLRELGVQVNISVPEPNTWHEILAAIEGRAERRIAVQEYGKPSTELLDALRKRGAQVTAVPVYQWDLPEDAEPLRAAAKELANRRFEVTLLTTSTQLVHLLRIADEMKIRDTVEEGLRSTVIASIGPTTTETLREYGFAP